ncbi:CRISPR-associated helicase/endonuclease Cas3 [Clostridium tepidum]|uniref:CRISPR-associated helicase/endonuclease Cas3 n=1 Tax=Clostridium tepidum TaxID=1962263 RepID=A0A1S9II13_9CLOT|nr:CRISPR-associated helicase/endonuclease Cas3 [Clostridium tepidum]OOO69964.1 CRISPR-associated helicase/endonuclease Cas3 [Clostridium tepidum]
MNNLFLAKTNPRETIIEHTNLLLKGLDTIKKLYPDIKFLDWDILEIACIYHDAGKINTKFQNKLYEKLGEEKLKDELEDEKEIPHGYLSPAFLPKNKLKEKYEEDILRVLYQSIYYHHKRGKLDNFDPIKLVVKEDLIKYWQDFEYDKMDKSEKLYPSYKRYLGKRIDGSDKVYPNYIITKGLLNKLDYAASGHIDVEVENKDLFEKTYSYLHEGGFEPNELQRYMIDNQDKNNIIIASTGIGKTEASLFWIGNNKGFFTLPLRVSINAIYDRVKDSIGFKDVALLHSDTYSEYLKRDIDMETDFYDKTKQLSMPLTICTLDQLIDFIFKYEGYEIKLATLAYSKLIIDEIQMYSPDMIAYLIMALKYITDMGGKFSIVTATMPQIIIDFMKKEEIEFNPPVTYCKKVNNKVQLRHRVTCLDEPINIKHILKNYKNKKVLIIVNTVKKAQEIYDDINSRLKDSNVVINLFHSRFIKKHRAEKEKHILNFGDKNCKDTGIWITTQVVEASLDIDFDVLYTELSDVSGLFQRMGRAYRSRILDIEDSNVFVYLGGDKPTSGVGSGEHSIIDFEIFKLSKNAIKDFKDKELDEEEKMKIIESVYTKDNLQKANYYKKIDETIKWVKDIKEYELEKNEARLRTIFNESIIPQSVYEDNKEFIEEALTNIKTISKEIKCKKHNISNLKAKIQLEKDKIKKLIVDIPTYEFERAVKAGRVIDWVEIDKFNKIPVVAYDYSFERGLTRPKNTDDFDENLLIL